MSNTKNLGSLLLQKQDQDIAKKLIENKKIDRVCVGDTLDIELKITDGTTSRMTHFSGVCMALINGDVKNPRCSILVRKVATHDVFVERVFPIMSPSVMSITVKKYGKVRRARLYYLRRFKGKAARIKSVTPAKVKKRQKQDREAKDSVSCSSVN